MPKHRPTTPSAAPQPDCNRTNEIAAFYLANADRLIEAVNQNVRTPDRTIVDDACQYAWERLMRRPDIDLSDGVGWLVTVATRRGWQLAAPRRDVSAGAFRGSTLGEDLEFGEPASDTDDPHTIAERRIDHDRQVRDLKLLKDAERQAICLKAMGFSYEEIAEITGASMTTVNRRLAQGRARLRQMAITRANIGR